MADKEVLPSTEPVEDPSSLPPAARSSSTELAGDLSPSPPAARSSSKELPSSHASSHSASAAQSEVVESRAGNEAGLFTANFEWKKLPPALRVVYDKQGHRQEVIDGTTFWRFVSRCSVKSSDGTKPFTETEALEEAARKEGAAAESQLEGGLTEESLLKMLQAMSRAVAERSQPGTVIREAEEVEEAQPTAAPAQDDEDEWDDTSDDNEWSDDEGSSSSLSELDPENADEGRMLTNQDDAPELSPAALQEMQNMMGGMMGLLDSMLRCPAPSPEEQRFRALTNEVQEMRKNSEKAHLADLWETLLNNVEPEPEYQPRQYTPWNIRQRAAAVYRNFRVARYHRKMAKKEAAQERARRVALEEERKAVAVA